MANRIIYSNLISSTLLLGRLMMVLLGSLFISSLAVAVVKSEKANAGHSAVLSSAMSSPILNLQQQENPVLNSKHPNYLRVVLLSKIIPYIYWQEDAFISSNAPFNLCVIESEGESIDHLWPYINLLKDRTSVGRHYQLIAISQLHSKPDSLPKDCHIYYFGQLDQQDSRQLVKLAEHSGILTIGDSLEELKQGAMLAFIEERGKMKIYVNTKSVNSSSLKIKSSLLRIAKQL